MGRDPRGVTSSGGRPLFSGNSKQLTNCFALLDRLISVLSEVVFRYFWSFFLFSTITGPGTNLVHVFRRLVDPNRRHPLPCDVSRVKIYPFLYKKNHGIFKNLSQFFVKRVGRPLGKFGLAPPLYACRVGRPHGKSRAGAPLPVKKKKKMGESPPREITGWRPPLYLSGGSPPREITG